MAREAHGFLVEGLTLELQKWDSGSSDWAADKTQLCGIDSIDFKDGSTEEKDITDFCYAATGYRQKLSGLKEPGTLTMNVIKFDPKQDGQKMLNDAPINTRFKLTITIAKDSSSNDVITMEIQKKVDLGWAIKLGEQYTSSLEFAVTNKPQWA